MRKFLGKCGVAGGLVALSAGVASAAPTFEITPPTLDVVQLGVYASAILTGLAALWLIRKFIKTTNRS